MAEDRTTIDMAKVSALVARGEVRALLDYSSEEYSLPVRMAALEGILEHGENEDVIACANILAGSAESLIQPLLPALAAIPGDDALLGLSQGLSSPNAFIRSRTVSALAARPEPSVFSFLIRACRDQQPNVSRLARRLLVEHTRTRTKSLSELRPETLAGVMEELPLESIWGFLRLHAEPSIRETAIRRLAHYPSEDAINALLSTCLAGVEPFCGVALDAIAKNPGIKAEHIQQLLDWGSEKIQGKAFGIFASLATRRSVEYLTEGLGSRDPLVREMSVRHLFRIFGPEIVPVLMPLLKDTEAAVCRAVLAAIKDAPRQLVEYPLILAATQGHTEVRHQALMLAAEKNICVPELMGGYFTHLDAKLSDPHPSGDDLDDICNIMDALTTARPTYLLLHLIQGASSASPRLRRKAMDVLGFYEPEYRNEAYVYISNASDMHIVTTVAFALAEVGHPGALVPLIRVAMGRSKLEARQAREKLMALPELHDIEKICELVRSPHPAVRQFAINRLMEMGDPAAVAMLLQALEDGNEALQQQALARLVELGNCEVSAMAERETGAEFDRDKLRAMSEDADPRAIDMLLQAADDADEAVQYAAVEALGKFVNEERVAKRLMDFIGYGSVPVRQLVVQILGENQVKSAVDILITAISNIFLRSYAEEALRKIGDRRGYLAVVRQRKREKMFPKRAKLEREKLQNRYGAKRGAKR
jgi:HEAT repeat protein